MLVLARRVGETIVVGGDVRVTVLAVRGNQIRLGIAAPPSVRVLRQEVEDRAALSAETPMVAPQVSQLSLSDSKIMAGLIRVAQ